MSPAAASDRKARGISRSQRAPRDMSRARFSRKRPVGARRDGAPAGQPSALAGRIRPGHRSTPERHDNPSRRRDRASRAARQGHRLCILPATGGRDRYEMDCRACGDGAGRIGAGLSDKPPPWAPHSRSKKREREAPGHVKGSGGNIHARPVTGDPVLGGGGRRTICSRDGASARPPRHSRRPDLRLHRPFAAAALSRPDRKQDRHRHDQTSAAASRATRSRPSRPTHSPRRRRGS